MQDYQITRERLAGYEQHLYTEERAAATVEKYMRDIRSFHAWAAGRSVTRELAAGWKEALCEAGYAPATINAKLSALNGFFQAMGWNDCRVRFLRIQRQIFRDSAKELTRDEYERLLEAARMRRKERTALLLETVCGTGIRVSEVRYITVEAAMCGRAEIRLKGKIRVILLPGKLCRKLLKFAKKQKPRLGRYFSARAGKACLGSAYGRR